MAQVLAIDGEAVEQNEDVVRKLRGPDQVGTFVTLLLRRTGTEEENVRPRTFRQHQHRFHTKTASSQQVNGLVRRVNGG